MGDPKKCIYQFICDDNYRKDTNLIQSLLCMDWDYVALMLYAWSFSNNTAVTIAIKKNKYFLPQNKKLLYLIGNLAIQIKIKRNNQIHEYDKTEIKIV